MMRRFISMLMVAFVMAAMVVVSAMPAFAGDNNAGGGDVDCKLRNGNIIQVANVQACVALGGIVVDL
jgi:hypothetical protein